MCPVSISSERCFVWHSVRYAQYPRKLSTKRSRHANANASRQSAEECADWHRRMPVRRCSLVLKTLNISAVFQELATFAPFFLRS